MTCDTPSNPTTVSSPSRQSTLAESAHTGQSALVVEPVDLVGTFVCEVGVRQVWPFITFCDNRPTPSLEVRLYIDTSFAVNGVDRVSAEDETSVYLLPLNNLPVVSVEWTQGAPLTIDFDDGSRLVVSAEAEAWTTGDIWWFSPWRE